MHPYQEQISRRNCDSLEESYNFSFQGLQEVTDG